MATKDTSDSTPAEQDAVDDEKWSPELNYHRELMVEVIPPADTNIDDERAAQNLGVALKKIFNSEYNVDSIEFLSYPDADSQRQIYLLQIRTLGVPEPPGYDDEKSEKVPIRDRDTPRDGAPGDVAQTAIQKLRKALPSWTYRAVRLSYDPLGTVPATTTRLLVKTGRAPGPEDATKATGFKEFLQADMGPHLYQAKLTKEDKDEYTASVRVALFAQRHQAHTADGLADVARYGRDTDPADVFSGLRSSRRLMARNLRASSLWGYVPVSNPGQFSEPSMVRKLARGHPEYWDLLANRSGYDGVYKKLNHYGRFSLAQTDLSQFLSCTHKTYATDPWDDLQHRSSPQRLAPEVPVVDSPDGLETAAKRKLSAVTREATNPSAGGSAHNYLESLAKYEYDAKGMAVAVVSQEGNDSVPDLYRRTPTGEIIAVEAEEGNKSSPADLLINVIRAEQWDLPVEIVVSTRSHAGTVSEIVTVPYDNRGDEPRLYTLKKGDGITNNGWTQLLPKGVSESAWYPTYDGRVELRADGTCLAAGSATAELSTLEYDTPQYTEDDGTYIVEDASGSVLHRYDTREELLDEWTKVRKPLVPTRLTYIDMVTIKYVDDGTLETFNPVGHWDQPDPEPRHRKAVKTVFDTYTTAAPGERLARAELWPWSRTWYHCLTEYDPVPKNWFGRSVPEHIDTVENNSEGPGKDTYYESRAWVYPPGLVSPELPEYGDEPTYPDDWD